MLMKDKRVIRGEETYERILHSSMELISREGISGLTASKLSKEAGISKSSLFHHFKSTKEIPLTVMEVIKGIMLESIYDENIDSVEGIFSSFEKTLFSEDREAQMIGRVFFSLFSEGLFKKEYFDSFKSFQSISISRLSALFMKTKSPGITEEISITISKLIIASLDGLNLHSMLERENKEYIRCWNLQKKMILDYLNNGISKGISG
ncbi:TetR/AcrR family transcriptional regulator [Oceanispirochaeta sp. M1]|nr:TetR/AcrR family transcriptional regulator [Oceanispirochaeta sp. M1]